MTGTVGILVEVVDDQDLVRRRQTGIERPDDGLHGLALLEDGHDHRELGCRAHDGRVPT